MISTKLKALITILVFTGCLLWSTFSHADSLIILFSSGKIQQVPLKEFDAAQNNKTSEDKKNSYHLKWVAPKREE